MISIKRGADDIPAQVRLTATLNLCTFGCANRVASNGPRFHTARSKVAKGISAWKFAGRRYITLGNDQYLPNAAKMGLTGL